MTRRRGENAHELIAEAERLYRAGVAPREARHRLVAANTAAPSPIPRHEVGELVAMIWGLPLRRSR